MTIRKTCLEDIPQLVEVYAAARRYMRSTGNLHQWSDDYPSPVSVLADMQRGGSYVCLDDEGRVAGTFFFLIGEDPTYNIIYEGAWPSVTDASGLADDRYAVVHRVASNGTIRHMFSQVMDFCFAEAALSEVRTIRVDTHRDNATMQHVVTSYGFSYCGIIHLDSGDERLAYQLTR